MLLAPDRRTIEYDEAPDRLAAARVAGEQWREAEIVLARALAAVEQGRSYIGAGCSSTVQFAMRLGLAAEEARRLLRLGHALAVQPSLEERVRAQVISATAASTIAPVLSKQQTADELALWETRAEALPLPQLRREVRRAVAGERAGEWVVDVTVHVRETTREHFERARVVASRRCERFLTYDETFAEVVDHYLASFDPLLRGEGTRRVGPTSERPEDRYIPVAVRRAVRRRAGDACECPGCEHRVFLEFAHRAPHREGSGREASDLFLLCFTCHAMLDAGMFLVLGSTEDPTWVDWCGIVSTKRRPGRDGPSTDEERAAVLEMRERHGRKSAPQAGVRREVGPATTAAVATVAVTTVVSATARSDRAAGVSRAPPGERGFEEIMTSRGRSAPRDTRFDGLEPREGQSAGRRDPGDDREDREAAEPCDPG